MASVYYQERLVSCKTFFSRLKKNKNFNGKFNCLKIFLYSFNFPCEQDISKADTHFCKRYDSLKVLNLSRRGQNSGNSPQYTSNIQISEITFSCFSAIQTGSVNCPLYKKVIAAMGCLPWATVYQVLQVNCFIYQPQPSIQVQL